jgi:nucleoside-diphosphate-sugar epimerase
MLGWIPQIALKEGIRRTIEWQRFENIKNSELL